MSNDFKSITRKQIFPCQALWARSDAIRLKKRCSDLCWRLITPLSQCPFLNRHIHNPISTYDRGRADDDLLPCCMRSD